MSARVSLCQRHGVRNQHSGGASLLSKRDLRLLGGYSVYPQMCGRSLVHHQCDPSSRQLAWNTERSNALEVRPMSTTGRAPSWQPGGYCIRGRLDSAGVWWRHDSVRASGTLALRTPRPHIPGGIPRRLAQRLFEMPLPQSCSLGSCPFIVPRSFLMMTA